MMMVVSNAQVFVDLWSDVDWVPSFDVEVRLIGRGEVIYEGTFVGLEGGGVVDN